MKKSSKIETPVHMLVAAMIGMTLEGILQIEGVAFSTFVVYPLILMVYRSRK